MINQNAKPIANRHYEFEFFTRKMRRNYVDRINGEHKHMFYTDPERMKSTRDK